MQTKESRIQRNESRIPTLREAQVFAMASWIPLGMYGTYHTIPTTMVQPCMVLYYGSTIRNGKHYQAAS